MHRLKSGSRLPRMEWDAFLDSHYRPHLVVLHQAPGSDRSVAETTVGRLVASLSFTGNNAVKSYGPTIHVAFELAGDMKLFTQIVGARSSAREPEWASRSTAWLNPAIQQRITRQLACTGQDQKAKRNRRGGRSEAKSGDDHSGRRRNTISDAMPGSPASSLRTSTSARR
jgi:hypothetical protein